MYCENCGAPLDDDERFCSNCGTSRDEALTDGSPEMVQTEEYYSVIDKKTEPKKKLILIISIVAVVLALGVAAYFVINNGEETKTVSVQSSPSAQSTVSVQPSPSASPTTTESKNSLTLSAVSASLSKLSTSGANTSFSVSATSTRSAMGDISYSAENLLDNNPATAWVEGANDAGIGESVSFVYSGSEGFECTGLSINDGYGKSADVFNKNGIPMRIMISIDGVDAFDLSLQDTMSTQYVKWDGVSIVPGTVVKMTIKEVETRADDEFNDTAISDIQFLKK